MWLELDVDLHFNPTLTDEPVCKIFRSKVI